MRLYALLSAALPLTVAATPIDFGDACYHSYPPPPPPPPSHTSVAPKSTSTSSYRYTTTISPPPSTSIRPTTSTAFTTSSASSTTTTAASTPTPFTITAAHDGTPIHLRPVNAYEEGLYIGLGPASYCPEPTVEDCPPGTSTTLIVNNGSAALAVVVPGGQQLYVKANGAFGYTSPHSAYIPPGAVTTGFVATNSGPPGDFGFTGLGSIGTLACPIAGSGSVPTAWQVFADIAGLSNADVPNGNVGACTGFDALTEPATGVGAWEYT